MSEALAFLAGIVVALPLHGFLFGRWVTAESFRGYLRRIAARRAWDWLLERCTAGEALQKAAQATERAELLGLCLDRLRDLTHCDRLYFGPARLGAADQFLRVDADEDRETGWHRPLLIVSSRGEPWTLFPLEEASVPEVLAALGPPERAPGLAWTLARAKDEELQALPGAQRTALVHALIRDEELLGVVDGLITRSERRRQAC